MKRRMLCIVLICSLLFSCFGADTLVCNVTAAEKNEKVKAGDSVTFKGKNFVVNYEITGLWNYSYNVNVTVKNTGSKKIHNWALLYYLDENKITNIWNGKIANSENGVYLIDNAGWNMDIDVNASVQFGYTASYQDTDALLPGVFSLTSCEYEVDKNEYTVQYDEKSNGGGVTTADVKINNLTDQCMEDWTLEFKYGNDIQSVWCGEEIQRVSAGDNIQYSVRNPGWSQNINKKSNVTFGFLAKTVKNSDKFVPISLKCYSNEIDYECDSDNDQLSDYAEIVLGTDPYCADTDGDRLPDGYEYFYASTDPLMLDSDQNGIFDSYEDIDGDELNNYEEMTNETNPCVADTDDDGLLDGDELKIYFTNPLISDTDEDGLLDGEEVKMHTSPMLKDSDADGILDPDEMIHQTLTEKFDGNVQKVSISTDTNGFISNNIEINNISDSDTLVSNAVGIIGDPFEIFIDSESKTKSMVMKIYYNKEKLSGCLEKLAVLSYNEDLDEFQYVENTENNQTEGILSCSITQGGKYLLVNKTEWENAWKQKINYRSNTDKDIDVQLSIDVSGSMKGKKITNAKAAANKIVGELSYDDRMSVMTYNNETEVVCGFTNDPKALKKCINKITAGGATDPDVGLMESLENFNVNKDSDRQLIIICDGAISYNEDAVIYAVNNGIKINFVLIGSNESREKICRKISKKTNGALYVVENEDDIQKYMSKISDKIFGNDLQIDSDGDGLCDSYEINGMRISNGNIMYTNPMEADSDGDGLSDYDEMGDIQTKHYLNRNIKWFRAKSYPDNEDSDGDSLNDNDDDCAFEAYTEMDDINTTVMSLKSRAAKKKNARIKVSSKNLYSNHSLSCEVVEKNLDIAAQNYNSEKKPDKKKIDKYLKNAKLTINMFKHTLKNASGNLKHYIENTGTEKKANMNAFANSSEYKKNQKKNITKLIKAANKYSKKKNTATFYMSSNPNVQFTGGHYNTPKNVVTHSDLWLTAGDINAGFNAKITKNGKNYTAEVEYYLFDCYDWDKDIDQKVGFTNPKELDYLMKVGKGKAYRYRGYTTYTISWKQGSRKYVVHMPAPQPGPAPVSTPSK